MNSKMHIRAMAFTMMAMAAVASSAEIVHHDDKDFWVDEAGIEHQLFYEKGNSAKIWGLYTYADEALTTPAALMRTAFSSRCSRRHIRGRGLLASRAMEWTSERA